MFERLRWRMQVAEATQGCRDFLLQRRQYLQTPSAAAQITVEALTVMRRPTTLAPKSKLPLKTIFFTTLSLNAASLTAKRTQVK